MYCIFDMKENMEILKQWEDFTAAQDLAEENRDCEFKATGAGTPAEEGIEDGVVMRI